MSYAQPSYGYTQQSYATTPSYGSMPTTGAMPRAEAAGPVGSCRVPRQERGNEQLQMDGADALTLWGPKTDLPPTAVFL